MTEGVFRHKDIKFYYARVLLHPSPTGHVHAAPSVYFVDVSPYYGELPSRREPNARVVIDMTHKKRGDRLATKAVTRFIC